MAGKLLKTIARPFRKRKKKTEAEVELGTPGYAGRHAGRDALVVVTGPTASTYREAVLTFIATRKPLVIGCNNLPDGYDVDYHVFVNRKRFLDHGHKIGPDCRVLLSPYFLESQIEQVIADRPYELLMYRNVYPGEKGALEIRDGVVHAEGATVGPLACGAALVMGVKNVLIAGMDGYSMSTATHHYEEPDNKERAELLAQEAATKGLLADLATLCKQRGGRLGIITPTAYLDFHDPKAMAPRRP